MNFARLQQTHVPDLAPVYGGARGRTLSSRHQLYAWKALTEAGVKTIIDLREQDHSLRLPMLCAEYRMHYFHYPIDNARETVASMVELFPAFCEKIDEGDFYIACAMGLHRTDIALCTYWVFYAAGKGMAPPPIRGYRQADGHNTTKLMRVLNAFYQHKAEVDGKEPMPIEVFNERKRILNECSYSKTILSKI